jgi:hypothetical protein
MIILCQVSYIIALTKNKESCMIWYHAKKINRVAMGGTGRGHRFESQQLKTKRESPA